MATVSTVPTVRAGLVTVLDAAVTAPVTYAWPGRDAASHAVFFGPHPETADVRVDVDHDIATIKAGRKHRQEEYRLVLTVWTFRGDLTPAGAQTVAEQAWATAAEIEDVLADDPTAGLAAVQWIKTDAITETLFPFEAGWACELNMRLEVAARLT